MKISARIGQTTLYLFIISAGFQMGAALYESLVVTPLWSGSPPESVTGWNPVAQYAINPALYWGKGTRAYAVCALLLLIGAWFLPKAKRNLALIAGGLALFIFIWTISFFIPILMKTIATRGAGYSGDEITRMVNQWVNWNWVRFGAGCASWLAALIALNHPGRATALVETNFENDEKESRQLAQATN